MTDPLPIASVSAGDNIADMVDVTFIYDPALGSPKDTEKWGGRVIGLPRTSFPLPIRGILLGQPGFGRQQTVAAPTPEASDATTVRWEWVMQGATDPVDAFVDSLTGKGMWTLTASRTVVMTLVQRLFSAGIPRTTIQNQVPQLYRAIAAEIRAEDAVTRTMGIEAEDRPPSGSEEGQ